LAKVLPSNTNGNAISVIANNTSIMTFLLS